MSESPFVCRLCDRSFSSQKLLIDHNQFHVKNEPGLFMQRTDERSESTTSCSMYKSLMNVKQESNSLDLAVSLNSDDTLRQNSPNAESSTSNNFSTSVLVPENSTVLERESNSSKIEALDSGEVLVQIHDSSTDLKKNSNSPKIEASNSEEVLIQKLQNVHKEVEQSVGILWKGKLVLICYKCGRKCMHEEHLAEHYRRHIVRENEMFYNSYGSYVETQPPNRCDLCDLSFEFRRERHKHYKEIHRSIISFCNCDKKFPKQKRFLKHVRLFHPEKLLKCDLCFKGFLKDKDLKTHYYKVHRGENSREWYGKDFKSWLLINKILNCKDTTSPKERSQVEMPTANLKCDVCYKVFVRSEDLTTHYKSHRGEDRRKWFTEKKLHRVILDWKKSPKS